MALSQMSARARAARRREPASEIGEVAAEAAPIGHNKPQASLMLTAEEWSEYLAHVFDGARQRRSEFDAPFKRFLEGFPLRANPLAGEAPIGIEKWDDDVAGRAGDFRDKIAALIKLAEALHQIEKAPILVAQKAVDGFLKAFVAPLETVDPKGKRVRGGTGMLNVIADRLTLYTLEKADRVRRENARIAAEERAKAQALAKQAISTDDPEALQQAADAAVVADAAAQQATAPDRDLGRVHGAMGSTTSLRDNWIWEAGDLMKLVQAVAVGKEKPEYLTFNASRLTYAVKSEKVRSIHGVTIRNDQSAR